MNASRENESSVQSISPSTSGENLPKNPPKDTGLFLDRLLRNPKKISRRGILKAVIGLGVGEAITTACGSSPTPTQPSSTARPEGGEPGQTPDQSNAGATVETGPKPGPVHLNSDILKRVIQGVGGGEQVNLTPEPGQPQTKSLNQVAEYASDYFKDVVTIDNSLPNDPVKVTELIFGLLELEGDKVSGVKKVGDYIGGENMGGIKELEGKDIPLVCFIADSIPTGEDLLLDNGTPFQYPFRNGSTIRILGVNQKGEAYVASSQYAPREGWPDGHELFITKVPLTRKAENGEGTSIKELVEANKGKCDLTDSGMKVSFGSDVSAELNIIDDDLDKLLNLKAGCVFVDQDGSGYHPNPVVPYPSDDKMKSFGISSDEKLSYVINPDFTVSLLKSVSGGNQVVARAIYGSDESKWEWEAAHIESVTTDEWAINKETKKFDPIKMFPFVGSINDANHRVIDLTYGKNKLAVCTDDDITDSTKFPDLKAYRKKVADELNNNWALSDQLFKTSSSASALGVYEPKIIIKDGKVTEVVSILRTGITRYKVSELGELQLESKEEEPQLMQKLTLEGARFKEGDKTTIMTGAVGIRFVLQESMRDPQVALSHFQDEIDAMSSLGGNFVSIEWNSGEEYLSQEAYRKSLIQGIMYAKNQKGMRVELVLHSRGYKKENDNNWESEQISELNKQIVLDWQKLLSYPDVKEVLARDVDIFGVLAEAQRTAYPNDPNLWEAVNVIRKEVGNPNAICTFSLGEWGGDARNLIGNTDAIEKIKQSGIVIEIHPYRYKGELTGLDYIKKIQDLEIPVMIGELGVLPKEPDDDVNRAYIQKVLKFIKENGLSFAWFAVDTSSPQPRHIFNRDGITDYGRLVRPYFVNYTSN